MPTPDEVEKITDSVDIVPQANEEHDEPECNQWTNSMPNPDEVENITDSVGIVPRPNEEHDEPGDNADGVVVDLLKESARVSRHSVQIARMFNARQRREFPIFIWPQFVNGLWNF